MHSENITVRNASNGEIQQCKGLEFNVNFLKTSENNVHTVNECSELRSTVNVVWLTILRNI